ncbi:hypothetical protein BaOVIS_002720 [Babesia ovis]|uniref:Uncharacterized protein n=1 Tax=Babesia ovis TaxID=5869 RepID=A0A9W5T817_BABOV|nr:hypothetical protein BaOVIS_002720 [Babesia ovis]
MSSYSRKIGLKNDKFATRVTTRANSGNTAERRTASFYVLWFMLIVLVLSGVTEMITYIKRAKYMRF